MPYYNTRDLYDFIALYGETVGHIENIMHSHPGSNYIIAARRYSKLQFVSRL